LSRYFECRDNYGLLVAPTKCTKVKKKKKKAVTDGEKAAKTSTVGAKAAVKTPESAPPPKVTPPAVVTPPAAVTPNAVVEEAEAEDVDMMYEPYEDGEGKTKMILDRRNGMKVGVRLGDAAGPDAGVPITVVHEGSQADGKLSSVPHFSSF
jgi:hypothetical protein